MLKKTVLVRALSIAFSGAALSAVVMHPAMAQSNAAGTIYGTVAPGSATTVVMKNVDTNQTRTAQVDSTGRFQASALPVGHYRVTLMNGSAAGATSEVDVIAGQGVDAAFMQAGSVAKVEVTGRRSRIDVSNATNGATFTAKELAKLPVAHNVDAIIQLSPNTTRSDPTYSAGASIGGGGPSENAYYINGFPVTNPLTQLGASELPFGAIATAEIKTGGYGAEFGRSVGGVVNITGKSGTNNWEFGAMASTLPNRLRAKSKDIYFANSGQTYNKNTDGTLRLRHENDTTTQNQFGAYVGGPIVKDKLFMFVAVEETKTDRGFVNQIRTSSANKSSGWGNQQTKLDRYYTKFDWNITDNHSLEYTSIGDIPNVETQLYSYDYVTRQVGSSPKSSSHSQNNGANGGEDQILRYTGHMTDDFTVTALYGMAKAKHIYEPAGYNPALNGVISTNPGAQYPGFNYNSAQGLSGVSIPLSGATDEVKTSRIDLEYKLGQHTLRGGIDNNKMSSLNAGTALAGGGTWIYGFTGTPDKAKPTSGGTIPALTPYGGIAAQGYYVGFNRYTTASNAYAGQTAQYLEDQWHVTKDIMVSLGVRSEGFYNANQDGTKYIEQKHNVMPRLSATWDVNGDSTMKIYGSAGRYSVPMPTVVALRGANGSLNTNTYYTYTGTDANGLPTGLTKITDPLSANNEFGQAKDPKTIAAIGMKPSNQDELSLGFDKSFSPSLTLGAKVTYRKLRSTIDDFCDARPFDKYAKDHNIDTSNYAGFNCASFNPGEDADFWVDYAGTQTNYTKVHFTAAELGFEKAERTYAALDVYAEHPYRNGWYGKVNYTLSRNKGNTEGQTLSDLNTGQGDVAATTTWDYPELMQYANGLLPNDRKHQIKAFGFYDLTPEWTIGGNLTIASGRPKGCLGESPNPGDSPDYGVEHWCFGSPDYTTNVPAPRGTMGRMPWEKTLDMNVVYKPAMLAGLSFKVDVFNVFNTQTPVKRYEQYNSLGNVSSTFGATELYSAPRMGKLSVEYNHKF